MRRLSQTYITQFINELGLELKRVREQKNLSIDEAAALSDLSFWFIVINITYD